MKKRQFLYLPATLLFFFAIAVVALRFSWLPERWQNATRDVRRLFAGDYVHFTKSRIIMGGLQFYNLQREFGGGKNITNKQLHYAILKESAIPVEIARSILTKQKLSKDFKTNWRFYGGMAK